jgi:hypothetical protein
MTDDVLQIQRFITGVRAKNEFTLHETEKPELCKGQQHMWRTVVCDGGEHDIDECSRCGKQILCSCSFDSDYN